MRPRQARLAEEFAAALDGRGFDHAQRDPALAPLLTLAQGLQSLPLGPAPDFRNGLRQRLLAVAAVAPAPAVPASPWDRARAWLSGWRVQRAMSVTAGSMAAVVGLAGIATAGSRSLPGDPFYGVKRSVESLQISLARNDINRGKRHLQHAETRLDEIRQLVGVDVAVAPLTPGTDDESITLALGGSRGTKVISALRTMDQATRKGSQLLTEAYVNERRQGPLDVLARFAVRQKAGLFSVIASLPDEARDEAASSLELVEDVGRRADELIRFGVCGADCAPKTPDVPPDATPPATPEPLPQPTPSPDTSDNLGPRPCACATPEPAPSGSDSAPSSPEPSAPPSGEPSPTDEPSPSESPSQSPSPSPSPTHTHILPSPVPTLVTEPVEEIIDEVNKILPTPIPTPLPVPTP